MHPKVFLKCTQHGSLSFNCMMSTHKVYFLASVVPDMASIGWIVLSFVLLFCSTGLASAKQDTVDYIVQVITHLVENEPEVPRMVFYGTSLKNPFDNLLGKVLEDPRLAFTTKFIISGTAAVDITRWPVQPSLLLIQGELASARHEQIFDTLRLFKPSTRIMLLINTKSHDYAELAFLCKHMSYYNAVFLDEKNDWIIVNRVVLKNFPEPWSFNKRSAKRNVQRTITYSTRIPMTPDKPSLRWLAETATFLNTTVREISHNCNSTIVNDDTNACFVRHSISRKIDFEPWVYSIRMVDNMFFSFMLTPMTTNFVILAPRSPISTAQLFTIPFQWTVWVALLLVIVMVELVKIKMPLIFQNEPILLVVCGYERYNLNRAGIVEKLVLFSLIVVMFFISRAYETKILSCMISRPATQEIMTIPDLIKHGFKVKYDHLVTLFATELEELNGLLVKSNESLYRMDFVHAYIAEKSLSELKLLPRYYDPANKLYRYKIMEQSLGLLPVAYKLASRSELLEVFAYTINVFIESGIFNFWNSLFKEEPQGTIYGREFGKQSSFLYFNDLFPVLVLISYGFIISFITFSMEVISHKFPSLINWKQMIVTIMSIKNKFQ